MTSLEPSSCALRLRCCRPSCRDLSAKLSLSPRTRGSEVATVFISYSHEDSVRVRQLAMALMEHGHAVWWDRRLKAGQDWGAILQQRIEQADAVVVVWTSSSICSEFVLDEAGRSKGKLVPAAMDGVSPPLGFGRLHTINLSAWLGGSDTQAIIELSEAIDDISTGDRAAPRTQKKGKGLKFFGLVIGGSFYGFAVGALAAGGIATSVYVASRTPFVRSWFESSIGDPETRIPAPIGNDKSKLAPSPAAGDAAFDPGPVAQRLPDGGFAIARPDLEAAEARSAEARRAAEAAEARRRMVEHERGVAQAERAAEASRRVQEAEAQKLADARRAADAAEAEVLRMAAHRTAEDSRKVDETRALEARRAAEEKMRAESSRQGQAARQSAGTSGCSAAINATLGEGAINFKRASAELEVSSRAVVDRLSQVAKGCEGVIIEVAAHTDSEGSPERNQRLSDRRARTVVDYLVKSGVPSDRLVSIGYGDTRPIAPNDTAEGRATNRRIELSVKQR